MPKALFTIVIGAAVLVAPPKVTVTVPVPGFTVDGTNALI
jgi:hypothetical protein